MTKEEFDILSELLLNKAREVRDRKRLDYASNEDVLTNFKDDARDTEISVGKAWYMHASKQRRAVRKIMLHPEHEAAEPAEQRFIDEINYILIGWAIYNEREKQ